MKKAKNPKKTSFFTILTYILALLFLIGGLVIPFGNMRTDYETIDFKNSLVMQLIPALNIVVQGITGNPENLITPPESMGAFKFSFPASLRLSDTVTWNFDFGAFMLLAYAAATVIAVICLIFVIGLRKKRAGYKVATFTESLSLLTTMPLLIAQMVSFSIGGGRGENTIWALSLMVAVAGPLLMLILQSFSNGVGSAIGKTVLAAFAVLSVMLCVFPVNLLFNLQDNGTDFINGIIKDGNFEFFAWSGIWAESADPNAVIAAQYMPGTLIGQIYALFSAPFFGVNLDGVIIPAGMNYGDFLNAAPGEMVGKITCIFMLALGLVVIINMFFSIFGLGRKTKKSMIVANLVRFAIQLILTVVVMILGAGVLKADASWMSYLLMGFAVLNIIFNIVRLAGLQPAKKAAAAPHYDDETKKMLEESEAIATGATAAEPENNKSKKDKKDKKKEQAPEPVVAATPSPFDNMDQRVPEYTEPTGDVFSIERKATSGGLASQAMLEKELQAQGGTDEFYNPVIYDGPSDAFIETLSNEEKVEFAKTFIERKTSANLAGIPEYSVDGDNTRFFNSIFVHFSRLRLTISDGLMRKFYDQVSNMRRYNN